MPRPWRSLTAVRSRFPRLLASFLGRLPADHHPAPNAFTVAK